MATFRLAYVPEPAPANFPPAVREYLNTELQKISRAFQLANGVAVNHEERIQTLEP